jgi:hypothetical protein
VKKVVDCARLIYVLRVPTVVTGVHGAGANLPWFSAALSAIADSFYLVTPGATS